jgi:signal transduction histidine kinase
MRGRLTISARIRIAEILALLIILAVGATAFVRTLVVARRVERFAGEQFPDTLLLAQIAQGRLEADRAANAAFALGGRSPELRDELDGDIEIALTAVNEGMTSYASRPRQAETRVEWNRVAQAIDHWRKAVEHLWDVSRRAGSRRGPPPDLADDDALAAWQAARTASQDAETALLSYLTKVAGEVQQVRQESTSSTRIALWLIGLAVLAGAVGHVVGGRLLRRSVGRTLTTLVAEAGRLELAVENGQLDVRGDPAGVSAEFRPIVEGMNKTLDAFVSPLRLTARHIAQMARGEIPESASGVCHGEFEVLRNNLNQCVADLKSNRKSLAEAQKQLLLADRFSTIGAIAGGVAHEVNNPLAAVVADLGYLADEVPALLEKARRDPGDAGLQQRAAEIGEVFAEARHAAQRVAATVRDLADVARPAPTSAAPVSLPELIERALSLASGELEGRVHVVRDFGPVPQVTANSVQLAQVFLRLVVNAAQAVAAKPSGEGEIRIATRADERGGAVVEVRDDGPGIDPATREHIFEPFLRTRSGTGSGLGLSVCHAIVLGSGGLLEVESEPGHGSLFRVVLPPVPAEEHLPPGHPSPAPIARGRALSSRVVK